MRIFMEPSVYKNIRNKLNFKQQFPASVIHLLVNIEKLIQIDLHFHV